MTDRVFSVAVRPFEGLSDKTTVPVKPFTGPTVTVRLDWLPTNNMTDDWLMETEKSTTLTVKTIEWDNGPLVPVTVTVYVPGDVALRVSTDVPAPVTDVGSRDVARPVGERGVNSTVPEKPLMEATVMLEVEDAPLLRVTADGSAARLKSTTFTVTAVI